MSRDERHLVSASEDCSVRIWNLKVEAALKQDGDGVHVRAYNAVISSSISLGYRKEQGSSVDRERDTSIVGYGTFSIFHSFVVARFHVIFMCYPRVNPPGVWVQV
jgi:hypothetical protein